MRIVLLGLAGAGKGTQGPMLAKHLGVPFVASGDLFRHHQAQATQLGLLAKGYMDRGELVPDQVTIRMILERIGERDCAQGFILDGFPRTLGQAEALDGALGSKGIDRVIYIKVGEEELVRRLSGRISCRHCGTPYQRDSLPAGTTACPNCRGELYQRPDDQPDVVRRRLGVQWPELDRLVDYYAHGGKLVEINGEQGVDLVWRTVLEAVSRPAHAARAKVAGVRLARQRSS